MGSIPIGIFEWVHIANCTGIIQLEREPTLLSQLCIRSDRADGTSTGVDVVPEDLDGANLGVRVSSRGTSGPVRVAVAPDVPHPRSSEHRNLQDCFWSKIVSHHVY
jgi:hypothetical protein